MLYSRLGFKAQSLLVSELPSMQSKDMSVPDARGGICGEWQIPCVLHTISTGPEALQIEASSAVACLG